MPFDQVEYDLFKEIKNQLKRIADSLEKSNSSSLCETKNKNERRLKS